MKKQAVSLGRAVPACRVRLPNEQENLRLLEIRSELFRSCGISHRCRHTSETAKQQNQTRWTSSGNLWEWVCDSEEHLDRAVILVDVGGVMGCLGHFTIHRFLLELAVLSLFRIRVHTRGSTQGFHNGSSLTNDCLFLTLECWMVTRINVRSLAWMLTEVAHDWRAKLDRENLGVYFVLLDCLTSSSL